MGPQKAVPLMPTTWLHLVVTIQACQGCLGDVDLPAKGRQIWNRGMVTGSRQTHICSASKAEALQVVAEAPCLWVSHGRAIGFPCHTCMGHLGRREKESQGGEGPC